MSGRPAPNRGKRGHKRDRFETADHSRQPGNSNASSSGSHSGKFGGREPPPRFLSRPRNGDGRSNSGGDSRDHYDDYGSGGRRGGTGPRQGPAGSPSGRSSNLGESLTHGLVCPGH